jgi:solute carrier family 25 carnitine/acylcarnitine transporter 20/29
MSISQSSKAPAAEETKNSAIDNVKSFIAGGLGVFSAVLVGEKA